MAVKCLNCGAAIRYYEHFGTSGCTNPECPYNIDNLISKRNRRLKLKGQSILGRFLAG